MHLHFPVTCRDLQPSLIVRPNNQKVENQGRSIMLFNTEEYSSDARGLSLANS